MTRFMKRAAVSTLENSAPPPSNGVPEEGATNLVSTLAPSHADIAEEDALSLRTNQTKAAQNIAIGNALPVDLAKTLLSFKVPPGPVSAASCGTELAVASASSSKARSLGGGHHTNQHYAADADVVAEDGDETSKVDPCNVEAKIVYHKGLLRLLFYSKCTILAGAELCYGAPHTCARLS